MEEKLIEYCKSLYAIYGIWCVALVGVTFAIMILVNLIIGKIFAKCTNSAGTRVRKTLATCMVYVVAGTTVGVAQYILKQPFDIYFILVNCIPVGALAQIAWAVYKIVRDLGFGWLVSIIAKSNTIKNALKDLPLDNEIALNIYNKLVTAIKESKGENAEIVEKKQTELIAMASSMLNGFVEADKVSSTAVSIVDTLKLKFSK